MLGPLQLITIGSDGERCEADLDLRPAFEAAFRELVVQPDGVQGARIARRANYSKAYDLISGLRDVLAAVGLTIPRPGSNGYRVTDLDHRPVEVRSDLYDLRERIGQLFRQRQAIIDTLEANDSEAPAVDLIALDREIQEILAVWRWDHARDRERSLQRDPGSDVPSSDLKLDGDIRRLRFLVKLGLARVQGTAPRYRDAEGALRDMDRFSDPSEIAVFASEVHALELERARQRQAQSATESEVFLAAPMASADEFDPVRELGMEVAVALRTYCGVSTVYFAAETIGSAEDFEEPAVSMDRNIGPLKSARAFVMVLPEPLCSSVLVEAGMALAMGMPSVYLVPARENLPWLLREPSTSGDYGIASARIIEYSDSEDLIRRLKNSGHNLFPSRPQIG